LHWNILSIIERKMMLIENKKMAKIALLTPFFLLLTSNIFANTAKTGMRNIPSSQIVYDMGVGWNLGNTLDCSCDGLSAETCWGNPVTTQAMIDEIAKRGFKTMRLPVTWDGHMGGYPNYTIDSDWLDRVEEIANYAFTNDMYVIINLHHEESWVIPSYDKKDEVIDRLTKVWTQIANRFQDYSDFLIFELLNEARLQGSANEWIGGTAEGRDCINQFHKAATDAIRATGGNNTTRKLMIAPYAASSTAIAINDLEIPNGDPNTMVSIHSYFPWLFCLREQTDWGTNSDKEAMDAEFDKIYNAFIDKGYPVVMGEWGATNNDNLNDRLRHAAYYTQKCREKGICPVLWSNGKPNEFGIFDRNTLTWHFPAYADTILHTQAFRQCTDTELTHSISVNGGIYQNSTEITVRRGDNVSLKVEFANPNTASWTLPDGTTVETNELTLSNIQLSETGTYEFHPVKTDQCNSSTPVNIHGTSTDCAGIKGGTAFTDQCGECVGGTTGLSACYLDCNGDRDGTASIDKCGICSGGNTGIVPCSSTVQGEAFCSAKGEINTNNEGFLGDGFLNYENIQGASALWYLYADSAKTTSVGMRFANGSGTARPLTVLVNGTEQSNFESAPTGNWITWTMEYITLNLSQGVNTIELSATTADGGPNIDLFALNDPAIHAGSCTEDCSGLIGGIAYTDRCGRCVDGTTGLSACEPTKAQAEDITCYFDGTVDDNHPGFEGYGFINGYNSDTTKTQFTLYTEEPKTIIFGFRYANGSTEDRPCRILINGTETDSSFSMPPTWAWNIYQNVETAFSLEAGTNEITLDAISANGFSNLDYYYIYGDATFGDCNQTIKLNEGWNLMSINLHPNDSTVHSIFQDLDITEIKSLNSFWKIGQAEYLNSLQSITTGQGYLVYLNTEGTLTINGKPTKPKQNRALDRGWNLIGVTDIAPQTFEEALNLQIQSIKVIKNFDGFWIQNGTQTITHMEPGKAYFVKQ